MMEKFETKKLQEKEVNNIEIWEELLDLFGTEEAKENFVNLCRRYKRYLNKNRTGTKSLDSIESSDRGQANIHNSIMETLNRLMTQSDLTIAEKQKFAHLANRKKVAEMIDDVMGFYSPREKEEIERMTELGRMRKGIF